MNNYSDFTTQWFSFKDNFLMEMSTALRLKVFVHEQKVPEHLEIDGYDESSEHLLIYQPNTNTPIATCRCRKTSEGIKIERFATEKTMRKHGFGKFLMETVLKKHQKTNDILYLYAQINVIGFYEKFGFYCIGKTFEEAGIQHRKMIYQKGYGKQR